MVSISVSCSGAPGANLAKRPVIHAGMFPSFAVSLKENSGTVPSTLKVENSPSFHTFLPSVITVVLSFRATNRVYLKKCR